MVKKRVKCLQEMFDEFILEKECTSISQATVHCYKECFERFMNETGGGPASYENVLRWITILKSKEMSTYSINHYLRGFRGFVYWCMRKQYIEEFKVPLQRCQESKLKMVNDDDLEKLLGKPQTNFHFRDYRSYVIICFIMATGARASTIVSIKNDDIDWKNKEIILARLKNKNLAVIPLSTTLEHILRIYLNTWDIKSDYLFPNCYGNQLSLSTLGKSIRIYCKKRGTKEYGPHAFRHSFARTWIKNNGSCFALQKMLTHSDLTMTKKYVRLFGNDLKEKFDEYVPLDTMVKNERGSFIKRKSQH